jgi:hypothetical protein
VGRVRQEMEPGVKKRGIRLLNQEDQAKIEINKRIYYTKPKKKGHPTSQ